MHIHINIHHHNDGKEDKILEAIHSLTNKIDHFMSNTSVTLEQLKTQFSKAYTEVTTKIQALIDANANNQDVLSPESQTALDDLKTIAQKFDDIVPDAPVEEPIPEVPAPDQTA